MAEQFLLGFLRSLLNQDIKGIQQYVTFLDPSSPVMTIIAGSNINSNWDSLIHRVATEKASVFQNAYDVAYDVDDLLEEFLKTFIDTARLYSREDYKTALEKYTECFKDFARLYKVLSKQYRDDKLYLIFDTFCHNFKELALQTNKHERQKGESKEYLENAMDAFTSLRQDMNRLKSNETFIQKIKLLSLIETYLDWINFKLRNYKAVKDGMRSLADLIRGSNFEISYLPVQVRVRLCYNWGKIALLTGRIPLAIEKLEEALNLCPKSREKNIRLILKLLSIAKVLNGQKLKKKLMEKYRLLDYYQLTEKIAKGDLQGYYWEVHFRLIKWVKSGLVLLLDNIRFVIYRSILQKWHKVTKANEISFSQMKRILELNRTSSWHHEYSEDEIQGILSNMIGSAYIRGMVSINEQKAIIRSFPKLRDINLEIQKSVLRTTGESL